MKFYIDENLMPSMADQLNRVFRGHNFRTPSQEHCRGLEDIELFDHLQALSYDALITGARRQLERPDERQALRKAGLSWLGIKTLSLSGAAQLATQTAIVLNGLAWTLDEWCEIPSIYRLHSPKSRNDFAAEIETV